jgi:hypothetical protein
MGWDPLEPLKTLTPKDPAEFKNLQNQEINNGRLAMIAFAGMMAQEAIYGEKLFPVMLSVAGTEVNAIAALDTIEGVAVLPALSSTA